MSQSHRDLPVQLTQREKLGYGEQLAQLHQDDADAEELIKTVRAQHNATKKARALERARLAEALRTGEELRAVEVREERDWKRGVIIVIRTDTSSEVEQRPMTIEERQREMELS